MKKPVMFEQCGVIVFGAGANGMAAIQEARRKADKVVVRKGYAMLYRIKR